MNLSGIERHEPARTSRSAAVRWLLIVSLASAVAAATHGRVAGAAPASSASPAPGVDRAVRGAELLLTKGYLPADFDQEVFDELWTVWEEPARSLAEAAPVAERRRMAMERYGLTPHPGDPSRSVQYVVDASGAWVMSCLACHQGQVAGRTIPGLANASYALETLTEEVRLVKLRQRKAFGHMDLGSLLMPLGTTNGTTNAVVFGVALMRHRAADLAIVQRPPRFDLMHHDMDAPAWWHYRTRKSLYADGFAPKGHRMLMQFLLVKENGPEQFREWEDDFRSVEAWIESLEAPKWPGEIDAALAGRGHRVYADHCADCHGIPGAMGGYPEKIVDHEAVGTDQVRLEALSSRERGDLNRSWFAHFGDSSVAFRDRESPRGYVAPPLDGIWATAPYFHNGSVPTLWHVLTPEARPAVWKRTPFGYDSERVGLEFDSFAELPRPESGLAAAERRRHFDTTRRGKSAAGHDFGAALDTDEKRALLEYLKTL